MKKLYILITIGYAFVLTDTLAKSQFTNTNGEVD